ncbi:DUF5994 family protein [Kibdelosporangium phytohabitans]|uniref:Uncharacterized protein n=1 Tax=Kibdelosporangium phytohabitans TaxID=860235 RepID=A0A0N9HRX7_9PSEU|nr:DUF5994 family protein [Kibdelosporangium phytohabitans]ALG09948.1 hypothetical protein AOZ06_26320 [Kibdelosporangium phytohabitans]MBE1468644.1 hypothetical protein [Kibdelosporangium phytohabitans]
MTSGRHTDLAAQTTKDSPVRPLRLRLKPKAPPTGYVDGAWWPHSHELADELTALATVLSIRLGPVTRVAFAAAAWNPVSEEPGRTIRLAALRSQEKHIVRVSGAEGRQLTLLVVPPETSAEAGHDAIMLAARRANSDQPADILAAAGVVPAAAQNTRHRSLRPRMRTRHPQG